MNPNDQNQGGMPPVDPNAGVGGDVPPTPTPTPEPTPTQEPTEEPVVTPEPQSDPNAGTDVGGGTPAM